jgi:hypothetical protein
LPDHTAALYEPCVYDGDCASNLCVEIGAVYRCSQPCCSSAACGAIVVDQTTQPKSIECADIVHDGALVRACARPLADSAVKPVGDPCKDASECRGGRCIDLGSGRSVCSDACCDDPSCGDEASFACRLGQLPDEGGALGLRCEPK